MEGGGAKDRNKGIWTYLVNGLCLKEKRKIKKPKKKERARE